MRLASFLMLSFFLLLAQPLYAQSTPPFVNASTLTITSGGAWQSLFPVTSGRASIWIENPATATSQGIGTAESLFFYIIPVSGSCLVSGTAGAFELTPGGSFVQTINTTSQALCVYSGTTGHAFIGSEQ